MTWKRVRQEQETTIRLDPGGRAGASTVRVWSASPTVWRKMDRLGIAPVKQTTTTDGDTDRQVLRGLCRPVPLGPQAVAGSPSAASRSRAGGARAVRP